MFNEHPVYGPLSPKPVASHSIQSTRIVRDVVGSVASSPTQAGAHRSAAASYLAATAEIANGVRPKMPSPMVWPAAMWDTPNPSSPLRICTW